MSSIHVQAERLAGKNAFISGAGSGIGRASALLFARHGCKVVVADLNLAAATTVVEEIRSSGGVATALSVDVTQPESVCAAFRDASHAFGPLNILYNNVGGSGLADGFVTEAPLEELWRCLNVDLLGTWLCCKYGIPELIRAGGGSVINTTSALALMGVPGKDAYTAAKGAVAALTRSMAVEFAPKSIRVNAIAPSVTRTPRVEVLLQKDGVSATIEKQHLLGILVPDDVAYLALYLASNESRVTTGQVIAVDSGITIS